MTTPVYQNYFYPNNDTVMPFLAINSSPPYSRIYASVNWVTIVSCNGLSPAQRQDITWNIAGLFSITPLGTSFSEIWIGIWPFSFKKEHLKTPSGKVAAALSRGRWVKGHMNDVNAIVMDYVHDKSSLIAKWKYDLGLVLYSLCVLYVQYLKKKNTKI